MIETEYAIAKEKYAGMRDACYARTWEVWSERLNGADIDLRIFPIDEAALQQAETLWPLAPDPGLPDVFPWRDIYGQVCSTPRRFDIAIWNGAILCGLAAGKASRGNAGEDTNVTIRYLQRAGAEMNPLKGHVAEIVVDATAAYATFLGKRMIYIKEPLPRARPRYEQLGFVLATRRAPGIYMGLRV